jgi:hypothetical protein
MTEQKKNPFKTVSEQLPFFPDLTAAKQEPFVGVYVDSLILGDSQDVKEQIPVYIFADVKTGEKVFIIQSYAIKKAVEAARKEFQNISEIVFRFEFLGKTEVSGKPFNKFNTGYCTLHDYELSEQLEVGETPTPEETGKGKGKK